MYTVEQKRHFAKLLHECNNNAFLAGEKMFPNDMQEARKIAHFLSTDAEIDSLMASFAKADGNSDVNENEIYVERHLKSLMHGAYEDKDKLKAIELFMRLKGLDRKIETNVVNNFSPAVIEVEKPANWEDDFMKNQTELRREL